MLEIQAVQRSFGATRALENVEFTIAPGEIFALLGPNGSGKTTLTRIIAGLLRPDAGDVRICGASVTTDPQTTKRHVGYIPDNPEAWGRLTGYEFLHFIGSLYDIPFSEREERIAALLPKFALADIQHIYFDNYSRGNRQKFTILSAFLHEPTVLLIDEPIVGLDPDSVQTLEEMLQAFAAAGGVVMITTHTLAVADRIADRVGFLTQGKLTALDTVSRIKSSAGLSADASLQDVYRHVLHTPMR